MAGRAGQADTPLIIRRHSASVSAADTAVWPLAVLLVPPLTPLPENVALFQDPPVTLPYTPAVLEDPPLTLAASPAAELKPPPLTLEK
jgi:hypothetical protein